MNVKEICHIHFLQLVLWARWVAMGFHVGAVLNCGIPVVEVDFKYK